MKKIINYYANLEIMSYVFFGVQMVLYMIIAYINGVESIKISMLAQVLITSLFISIINDAIFKSNKIKEKIKAFISYIANLIIILFCAITFEWTKELKVSEVNIFIIYTGTYIAIYIIYGMYLKLVGEHYTNSLKIYKERKRR